MTDALSIPCSAFAGFALLAQGSALDVMLALRSGQAEAQGGRLLVFEDVSGTQIDFDLRGSTADVVRRLGEHPVLARLAQSAAGVSPDEPASHEPRRRGRPKLGVVAREVTLLPRHWAWLGDQPGGASQALRRLVDQARKLNAGTGEQRKARERAYRFMSAIAGDLPEFEAASRALFSGDAAALGQSLASWPADVRAHVVRLAEIGDGRDS